MQQIQEKQQSEVRYPPDATRNALKRLATHGGGRISFNMQYSGKPFLQDLLKGFEEYAKIHGYRFGFLIDSSRPDGVTFKFTLDPSGQNDRTSHFRQDFVDYLNMVEKRDSFDHLPVIPWDPAGLLAGISIKNGPLYTTISRCRLLSVRPKTTSHSAG